LQPSLLQVPSLLPPQIAIFRYKLCGTLILIEAVAPVNYHSDSHFSIRALSLNQMRLVAEMLPYRNRAELGSRLT
jgi:hypothetical protein